MLLKNQEREKNNVILPFPMLLMLQQVLMALGHQGDGLQIKVSNQLSQKGLVKFQTKCLNPVHALSAQRWKKKFIYFVILSNLRCSSVIFFISFLNLKIKNSQTQLISSVLQKMESDNVLELYKRSVENTILDIILVLAMTTARHTTLLTGKNLTVQTSLSQKKRSD